MTESGRAIRFMNRLLIVFLILWIPQIAAPQDAPDQPMLLFTVESVRDYEVLQFVYGISLAAVQNKSQSGGKSGEGPLCIPDQVEPLAFSLLANLNRRFDGAVVQISEIESAIFEVFDEYYVCDRSSLPMIISTTISEFGLEKIVLLGSDGLFRCVYSVDGIGEDSPTKFSAIDIDPERHRELAEQFERLDLQTSLRNRDSWNLNDYYLISVGGVEDNNLRIKYKYEVPKVGAPASVLSWLEEVLRCANQPTN